MLGILQADVIMATKAKERKSKGTNSNTPRQFRNNNEEAERVGDKQLVSLTNEQNTSHDEHNMLEDEEGGTRIGDIYIPPPIPAHCSTESKGPRLIIKKIENNNFKSYAGKVILGPFHHVSEKLSCFNIYLTLFVLGFSALPL